MLKAATAGRILKNDGLCQTVMAVDVIGKAVMLWESDFMRNPAHMVSDMVISVATLDWAAWLLGHEA